MHWGSQALQRLSPGQPNGQQESLNSVVSSRSCGDLVPCPQTGNLEPCAKSAPVMTIDIRTEYSGTPWALSHTSHLSSPLTCEEGQAGLDRKRAQRGYRVCPRYTVSGGWAGVNFQVFHLQIQGLSHCWRNNPSSKTQSSSAPYHAIHQRGRRKREVRAEHHLGTQGKFTHAKSLQSCPTLWDPMDGSPPDSSVHGILQARILERATMPSSRGSSWPRDRTHLSYVSCTGRQVLYH